MTQNHKKGIMVLNMIKVKLISHEIDTYMYIYTHIYDVFYNLHSAHKANNRFTKEKEKEIKTHQYRNQQFIKEGSKRKKEKKGTAKQPENNKMAFSKSLPINNYSKCKWIEFSIKIH